ncbi:DNA mismatch repair endonuclease MutL [Moheibacter sediminis]|nr:DNA mismatch repair endonuclease MutL [Moheibacter sediminis]
MGDVIQLLPDHVANQIAAGEVVQRPASVVKELIENAVDAKANSISLIIKDAGRTLIQVSDDGAGMSVTDLRMAFERHATSKIRTTEDIFSIQTKGFRGEALASIAAVAQVDAVSKRDQDEVATRLIIEGGEVRDQVPRAARTGTSISVKNLFYNVPARRNFLKSNQIELKHIQDEFLRVALAHEAIEFNFYHNDSELYVLKKGNLKQRIIQVFGRKIEPQLVPVAEETEIVSVKGFVGKPESAKKARGEQYFFVNNRFIKNNYLHKAIVDAFEHLLPNQYVPSYFLFLEIDPSKIDINIHPTKTEIKFEDEYAIYAVLRAAVKHALGQYNITPSLDFDQNPDWAFIPSAPKGGTIKAPEIHVDRNYNPFETSANSYKEIQATNDLYKSFSEFELENNHPETILDKADFDSLEINAFQWQNKYIVTHHKGELLIIDQHRAHQLILFEKLKKSSTENALSQRLLFPVEIISNATEISQLKNIETDLFRFGFDVEFTIDQILVNALPTEVEPENVPGIFSDFLTDLELHDKISFEVEIAKILAKNVAIKKGEGLLPEQAKHLAQQLLTLGEPNFSPYGKPVFVQISESEIIKKLN